MKKRLSVWEEEEEEEQEEEEEEEEKDLKGGKKDAKE